MTTSVPTTQGQVLLIDDDELIAGSLRQYLVREGVDVDVAGEQKTAAMLMRERSYRVVVIDPYFTGAVHLDDSELLDTVTLLQPGARIVVVTGYGTPELAQRAGQSNIALLSKPQPIADLGNYICDLSRRVTS